MKKWRYQPADTNEWLNRTAILLFTHVMESGFWDSDRQIFISKLTHDRRWRWEPVLNGPRMYGLSALWIVLLGRVLYSWYEPHYDPLLRQALNKLTTQAQDDHDEDLLLGGFNALVLGTYAYDDDRLWGSCAGCLSRLTKYWRQPFRNNNHFVSLIGLGYYMDLCLRHDDATQYQRVKELVEIQVDRVLEVQHMSGRFDTGDVKAHYLQRMFYVLWGLMAVARHYQSDRIELAVRHCLQQLWLNRRVEGYDVLYWHPDYYNWSIFRKLQVPLLYPVTGGHMFVSHQMMYIISVAMFQHFFRNEEFMEPCQDIIAWVRGNNQIQTDLVKASHLGVAVRMMDVRYRLDTDGEHCKDAMDVAMEWLAQLFVLNRIGIVTPIHKEE